MIYYKGFSKDLTCRGNFQFEVGKTYDTGYDYQTSCKEGIDEDDLCSNHVFHFCNSVEDVDDYYPLNKSENDNRLFEVEPLGSIVSKGGKFGSTKIRIIREIKGDEFDYLTGNGTSKMLTKRYGELFNSKNASKFEIVKAGCKFNYSDGNGSVISPDLWFDHCCKFYFISLLAKVEINGKLNIINVDGKLLSNQWFDWIYDYSSYFKDGDEISYIDKSHFQVKLEGKWNFIDTKGKYISNIWYDRINFFKEGEACVSLNDKMNYIDLNGEYLSNVWFDNCSDFKDGKGRVELNCQFNFIKLGGNYISDFWFDNCGSFKEGYSIVKVHEKYNLIDVEGECISDQWFDWCGNFYDDFSKISLNGKYNFMNHNGEIISECWFDNCTYFNHDTSIVVLNNKRNFINKSGKLLSDQWFDGCYGFYNGLSIVRLGRKYNYIDKFGKLVLKKYVDYCEDINDICNDENNDSRYKKIIKGNKFNFLDIMTKKLISDNWIKMPQINVMSSFYVKDKCLILHRKNVKKIYKINHDNKVYVNNSSYLFVKKTIDRILPKIFGFGMKKDN